LIEVATMPSQDNYCPSVCRSVCYLWRFVWCHNG